MALHGHHSRRERAGHIGLGPVVLDLNDAQPQSNRDRHVPWRAIKEAVKGRETEVLDQLGIDWQSRAHIHCPYPRHEDHNPSWRWDPDAAKARCSCDSSASIFDVIMKMEEIDFSTAQVRAAELLDRDDLINGARKKRHFWRKGDKACLYGAQWAASLRDMGYAVIVEGESDTQTLWKHSFAALGLPGATNWNEERDAPLLDGVPAVYVVIEPDTGGDATLQWLRRSRIAPRARLIRLPSETKDPSALYLSTPDRFRDAFRAAMEAAEPLPPTTAAEPEIVDLAAPYAIAKRLVDLNFRTDGLATLRRHRDVFYAWNGAAYVETEDAALRTQLYNFLEKCKWRDSNGELRRVKPNTKLVNNVLDGLRACAHLDQYVAASAWLAGPCR